MDQVYCLHLVSHTNFLLTRSGLIVSVPLSTIPLIFGQTSCTLVIQINCEGFDVFLNETHIARLEHRRELPSGKNSLFLNFPSTDDYNSKFNPSSPHSLALSHVITGSHLYVILSCFRQIPRTGWFTRFVLLLLPDLSRLRGFTLWAVVSLAMFKFLQTLGLVGKQTVPGKGRSLGRRRLQELQFPAPRKFSCLCLSNQFAGL